MPLYPLSSSPSQPSKASLALKLNPLRAAARNQPTRWRGPVKASRLVERIARILRNRPLAPLHQPTLYFLVSFYTTCRQHWNISATPRDKLLYSGNVACTTPVLRLMKLTSVTLDVLVVGEAITSHPRTRVSSFLQSYSRKMSVPRGEGDQTSFAQSR